MAVPVLTIVMWLLSFFLAKDKGMSTGKAALLATGVAAATYTLAEPTNEHSLYNQWSNDNPSSTDAVSDAQKTKDNPSSSSFGTGLVSLGTSAIETVGDVAKEWGPVGTTGAVIAATHGDDAVGFIKQHWGWLLGGAIAIFVLTRG